MWAKVAALVTSGTFAATVEIYEELKHLPGPIGECVKDNDAALQMEIEEADWDWQTYLSNYEEMKIRHAAVISEYNGNRKGCACRKSNPGILVMQSAQDWATKHVPGAIDGARPAHLSPGIDACGPHCNISCTITVGDGDGAR